MSIKNIGNMLTRITVDEVKTFVEEHIRQVVYIIGIILVVSFIVVFNISRNNIRHKQLVNDYYEGISFIKTDSVKAKDILGKIYNSKKADTDIKTIAGLRLAEILTTEKNNTEAITIYKNIYNLKGSDEFLKNLSGLTAVNLMINQNNKDNYNEIENILNSLVKANKPLSILADEQRGMFEIQKGNTEKGLSILENLLNQGVDEDTKTRIENVIGLYK